MVAFNNVILGGNLASDIELRHLPSGMAVADLRLAVSEKFKNRQGELVEKPVFVDVVVWDRQAENCAKYLSKGSPVLVEGCLQLDEWTSKEGEKRSKLRVRANTVQFLGKPRQQDQDSAKPADTRREPQPEPSFNPADFDDDTEF
jgi:single-strand DNA-binding protein